DPVAATQYIGLELLEPPRVGGQEFPVKNVLVDQHICDGQHERRVAARTDGQPPGLRLGRGVVTQWADRDEPGTTTVSVRDRRPDRMPPDTPGGNGGVLSGESAERHEEFGVLSDVLPRCGAAHYFVRIGNDVGQQYF